jgi:hypothetical protein
MKEFKFLEFKREKKSYELIEKALADKSAEGWEVVSATADISKDISGMIVVLLQRDK